MKQLLIILFLFASLNIFSQTEHLSHFGNYNPPDDPAINTGWLIVGFFLHLNGEGGGIILSAYGIGVFYNTRKMEIDFQGRVEENRRIIHKKKFKAHH